MKVRTILQSCIAVSALVFLAVSCQKSITGVPKATKGKEEAVQTYPEVPRNEVIRDGELWTEMKDKYKQYVVSLNTKIKSTGEFRRRIGLLRKNV